VPFGAPARRRAGPSEDAREEDLGILSCDKTRTRESEVRTRRRIDRARGSCLGGVIATSVAPFDAPRRTVRRSEIADSG
jgi:hypothetical protein